ncbi:MAG: mechanosensitive ion channel family protein [Desulfobacterales bacterium]|nr:mechanosensitive ion channel family protein [Desulfobacterales bacterium]
MKPPFLVAIWLFFLLIPLSAFCAKDENPLAPVASNPQATMENFINNFDAAYAIIMRAYKEEMKELSFFLPHKVHPLVEKAENYFEKAVQCLNLSQVSPSNLKDVGYESAMLLKEILDRIPLPPYDAIPGAKAVEGKEGLKSWYIPGTTIEIERVKEGPNEGAFLFSPETVSNLKRSYNKVKTMPYKPGASEGVYEFYISTPGRLIPPPWTKLLPLWTTQLCLDQTIWQWMGLVFALVLFFLINYAIFRFTREKKTGSILLRIWLKLLLRAIIIVSAFFMIWFVNEVINISGAVLILTITVMKIFIWLMIAWSTILIGTLVAETIIASPKIDSKSIDSSLVRAIGKLIGIGIGLYILLEGISHLGVSLVPILTGLGVAGLAVSLAARPTIENIIEGIMLYMDRPVRVGDMCEFGKKRGTILHIGLRSTRLRALDRTIISVPNATFSQLELINVSKRDRVRLRTSLGLRYETTPEQLRYVLTKLREMLIAHPKIYETGVTVRFIGFGDYSLNVKIMASVKTSSYLAFLGVQEDIFLRIMQIVEESGTDFAFPSQTVYVGKDTGLPEDLQRSAELQVQSWRSEGKLPFPNIPKERRKELLDTLDFPPEGSPQPS